MTHFPGTFPTKGSQKNELKYIIILLLYDHNHASTTGLQKRLFVKGRERQGSCLYDNHIFSLPAALLSCQVIIPSNNVMPTAHRGGSQVCEAKLKH